MRTLNLVYPENSDIKYTISKFPDGQQNIVIQEVLLRKASGTLPCKYECDCINPANYPYQIKSRLNNWLDLELIVAAAASLREIGAEEIHLYTPYILGARSDRKFEEGGNNYLKDVICPIINSLNFKSVTCIDPRSDVLEACIKGFRKESNVNLVNWAINEIQGGGHEVYKNDLTNLIFVSPDAGANKKIYKLAEEIGYKGDIITCSKDRDVNGKLSRIDIPVNINKVDKDFIIIDDICDGGATFINIANAIIQKRILSSAVHPSKYGKIYLIVTHGIFSKEVSELSKYFDGIYTTNSYKDQTRPLFETEKEQSLIKQLNVF